eukprot:Opistho-2@12099
MRGRTVETTLPPHSARLKSLRRARRARHRTRRIQRERERQRDNVWRKRPKRKMRMKAMLRDSRRHRKALACRSHRKQLRKCLLRTRSERSTISYALRSSRKLGAHLKRADISKFVMGEHGRATGAIIDAAQKRLEDTFGARLEPLPSGDKPAEPLKRGGASQAEASGSGQFAAKAYALLRTSKIGDEADYVASEAELPRMGFLLVLLILIRMSQNALPDQKLWEVLGRLGVQKGKDCGVGDPDKAIKEFERQLYIDRVKTSEGAAGDSTLATYEYRWGARAKVELDARDIISIAAQIYEADAGVWLKQLEPRLAAEEDDD